MTGKKKFSIACVQMNSGEDWRKNLEACQKAVGKACSSRTDLIAFPENFLWRGPASAMEEVARKAAPFAIGLLGDLARKRRVSILLGSLLEKTNQPSKYFNTSYLLSCQGRVAAQYRKIHLFDVSLGKRLKTAESRHILAGHVAVCAKLAGIRMGLSICYDLRFPELYRIFSRRGCLAAFVPANFTYETGKAHWELLLRARAVENQMYIIAPAQTGRHPSNKILSYGNAMVVDPWGRVLARGDSKSAAILRAELDFALLHRLRRGFPVLKHRRLKEM